MGKSDQEKAAKEAAEKAAKETAEKEAKETAEKEAAEKAAKETAEKEAAEKAAKEKAEKEAAEKAAAGQFNGHSFVVETEGKYACINCTKPNGNTVALTGFVSKSVAEDIMDKINKGNVSKINRAFILRPGLLEKI